MSLKNKTLIGIFWIFIRFGGRQLINVTVFFLLVLFLSPEEFGLGSIATSICLFLSIPVTASFRERIIQKSNLSEENKSNLFWLNFLLGLIFFGIIAFIITPIIYLFGNKSLAIMVVSTSFVPVFWAINSFQEGIFERNFKHKFITISQFFSSLIAAIISIYLAYKNFGAWALVIFTILERFFFTVFNFFSHNYFPKFYFNKEEAIKDIKFTFPIMIGGVLNGGLQYMIIMLVGLISGPAIAGNYRIGMQILMFLVQIVNAPMFRILVPSFSKYKGDKNKAFIKLLTLYTLITFPVFLGAASISPSFIAVFLGSEWQIASELSMYFCLSFLATFLHQAAHPLFVIDNKTNSVAIISVSNFVLGLCMLSIGLLLSPIMGGVLFCLRVFFHIPFVMYLVKKNMKISSKEIIKSFIYILTASIITFLISFSLVNNLKFDQLTNIIIATMSGGLFYLFFIRYILKIISNEQYQAIIDITPKRIRKFL